MRHPESTGRHSTGTQFVLDSPPDLMASSLVSILIAAYNAELWLGTTLRSVLAQTWPNVEVVVVDDGSTDGTAAIAQQCVSDTVRLIRQENRGACAARNHAFVESRGAFIQYLDADDVLAADKIERQMEYLEREHEDTVAYASWARFTGDITTADTPAEKSGLAGVRTCFRLADPILGGARDELPWRLADSAPTRRTSRACGTKGCCVTRTKYMTRVLLSCSEGEVLPRSVGVLQV